MRGRTMAMWTAAALLALAGSAQAAKASERHDCGAALPSAKVEGGPAERAQACEGLSRALAFFRAHGMEPDLDGAPIVYRFVSQLRLPCSGRGCVGMRVAGLYDAKSQAVSVTRSSEPWMHRAGRLYFKLPYNREMYVSVLAHESTHALNKQFYKVKSDSTAQDEYLAYASQLWSMDPKLRAEVLAKYPERGFVFKSEFSINDMSHAWDPHGFGVKSYRHFMGSEGGEKMMRRIYTGGFVPPSMDFE